MADRLGSNRWGNDPEVICNSGKMNGPMAESGSLPNRPTHLEGALLSKLCRQINALDAKLDQLGEMMAGRRKENFTVEEFAAMTGRAEYTVRRWIKDAKLKAVRLAEGGPRGRFIIPRTELERMVSVGKGASITSSSLG